jgi:hypothetical protein
VGGTFADDEQNNANRRKKAHQNLPLPFVPSLHQVRVQSIVLLPQR